MYTYYSLGLQVSLVCRLRLFAFPCLTRLPCGQNTKGSGGVFCSELYYAFPTFHPANLLYAPQISPSKTQTNHHKVNKTLFIEQTATMAGVCSLILLILITLFCT